MHVKLAKLLSKTSPVGWGIKSAVVTVSSVNSNDIVSHLVRICHTASRTDMLLPSQQTVTGHYRPASETPFKMAFCWRADSDPLLDVHWTSTVSFYGTSTNNAFPDQTSQNSTFWIQNILAHRIRISQIFPWNRKSSLTHTILPRTSSILWKMHLSVFRDFCKLISR